jgi:hypothetical protein
MYTRALIQKKILIVTLCGKYTWALISQNFCQADFCALIGLSLLLVNFFVTASSQIEGATRAIRKLNKLSDPPSSAPTPSAGASTPTPSTGASAPTVSDDSHRARGEVVVGEEAVAECVCVCVCVCE